MEVGRLLEVGACRRRYGESFLTFFVFYSYPSNIMAKVMMKSWCMKGLCQSLGPFFRFVFHFCTPLKHSLLLYFVFLWGAEIVQWWEHSPLTDVTRV